VSGVRCQENTEASAQKTACDERFGREPFCHEPFDHELMVEGLSRVDDSRKKADGYLP